MEVEKVMTVQVHSCTPDDSLELASQIMWDHDCGCLPVCTRADGKSRAVGVITDRDICMCALFEGGRLSELRVAQAMAKRLLCCQPSDSLEHAEWVMQSARVRRLPVVSTEGGLVGIVSLADLAWEAAREDTGRVVKRDISESEVGHTLAAICAPVHSAAA